MLNDLNLPQNVREMIQNFIENGYFANEAEAIRFMVLHFAFQSLNTPFFDKSKPAEFKPVPIKDTEKKDLKPMNDKPKRGELMKAIKKEMEITKDPIKIATQLKTSVHTVRCYISKIRLAEKKKLIPVKEEQKEIPKAKSPQKRTSLSKLPESIADHIKKNIMKGGF